MTTGPIVLTFCLSLRFIIAFPVLHHYDILTTRSSILRLQTFYKCLHAENDLSSFPDNEGKSDRSSETDVVGVRLNKVFKATHSRREADLLIASGRVCVNGKSVFEKGGFHVIPYVDVITLDGVVVTGWEEMNHVRKETDHSPIRAETKMKVVKSDGSTNHFSISNLILETPTSHFDYVKYWKPEGITCTTDQRMEDNIIDALHREGYRPKHRIYPVGRLDKDSSGLILLTSDGRLPNAVLRGEKKQSKVYNVSLDKPISESHIQVLRDGIVITTVAHRDGNRSKPLTAKTRPCKVIRLGPRLIQITLMEGRNRQIRKMLGALDYNVIELQRIEFMGIKLQDETKTSLLRPGDWAILDRGEMKLIENALKTGLSLI